MDRGILMLGASVWSFYQLVSDSGKCPHQYPGSIQSDDPSCHFSDCDEIDTTLCSYPYPSSKFLREDNTTETGYRIDLKHHTLPKLKHSHEHVDPTYINRADGFSTIGPVIFYLHDVIDLEGTLTLDTLDDYTGKNVKTLLMSVNDMKRAPHWLELDRFDHNEPSIIIQPSVPLHHSTRYLVAVRGILNRYNKTAPATKGFSKYRNTYIAYKKGEMSYEDMDSRSKEYAEYVFPILEKEGWDINEVQIAWNYVTISRKSSLGGLQSMRDRLLDHIDNEGLEWSITQVNEEKCIEGSDTAGRIVWVTMKMPSFMEQSVRGSRLYRPDPNDTVTLNGTLNGYVDVKFIIFIPCSIINEPSPSFVMQYGHGLFGDRTEALYHYVTRPSNQHRWIIVSTDWYGFGRFDLLQIVHDALSSPETLISSPDYVAQSFMNGIAMMRILSNITLINHSSMLGKNNTPVVGEERGFYGNSFGGIVGGAYTGNQYSSF